MSQLALTEEEKKNAVEKEEEEEGTARKPDLIDLKFQIWILQKKKN